MRNGLVLSADYHTKIFLGSNAIGQEIYGYIMKKEAADKTAIKSSLHRFWRPQKKSKRQ